MHSARNLVLAAVVLTAASAARASVISLDALAGNGWVAILPPGATPNNSYPSPDPIMTEPVALAFLGEQ